MSKPFMFIQAPVATRSGYGAHSRDIVHSLIEMDRFDIQIGSLRWGSCPMNALDINNPKDKLILDRITNGQLTRQPDIGVEIRIPNEYQCIGKYNIGITAGIETSLVAPEWVDGANRVDLNLVPSQHSKDVFVNTSWEKRNEQTQQSAGLLKLEKPMEVLFEGTDTDIYKKTNNIPKTLMKEMDSIQTKFNFLYVGHWLKGSLGQDRKDTGMLVKVFLESFKDLDHPPGLIMKTSGAKFSIMDRNEIMGKIESIKATVTANKLPPIYVLHGDLSDEEMNGLYNHPKVKAHASLTKGEGFGRPLLEATISQKPLMTSAWGGQIDFLDKDLSVLVPGNLTPIHESAAWDKVIMKEAKWFTADYGFAANVMKDMFLNYRKYTPGAVSLGIKNKTDFSLNAMTEKFEKILDKYLPNFSEKINVKLPKLKAIDNSKPIDNKVTKSGLPKLKKVEVSNATI